MTVPSPRAFLRSLFDAAVAAADPRRILPPVLATIPRPAPGRTLVVGAGKAAAAMAVAVEDAWGDKPGGRIEGLVVTRYGHGLPTRSIEVVEAGHPNPDEAGEASARRMLAMAEGLGEDDLLLALVSGGGSALLTCPLPGLALADLKALTRALLACGASIHEINCVRKHLCALFGGRLAAAAHPARVVGLAISDVPGDNPSVIASGPTVPDESTLADARAVLAKYAIAPASSIARHLADPANETPKLGDPRLARAETRVVVTPQAALEAAARASAEAGVPAFVLGDRIEGEAREVGIAMAGIAKGIGRGAHSLPRPCAVISGGETTVTVRGKGRGGRNVEFLLALAVALDGQAGIHAIACDTDGIDGTEDNAGAILGPDSLARAAAQGLDPKAALADNDAYALFAGLGDLVVTGPTRTNVNDFRVVLAT
ncbi:MAG: glycerate kinase [Alphaproteobacteria bacterium]|nr:glycerate kinase [Alphaproteobacteria bacterium]